MAILSTNINTYSASGSSITITFTTDVTPTAIELTKDGTNWISATSYTSSSATFDISNWRKGTYTNCQLKVSYDEESSGGDLDEGTTYTVTRNVTNCTSTGDSTLDTSITTTFQSVVAPDDGYTLKTLIVSMGGIDYTNEPNVITDTEWNGKPAKLITIENVNGNIIITASATQQSSSSPSDPDAVYDNPSYSVKDYKIILS